MTTTDQSPTAGSAHTSAIQPESPAANATHYAAARGWRIPRNLVRYFAWAALITNAVISVTGAVVRVTGSGLGCTTWPECHAGTLVPDYRLDLAGIHQTIEFSNRLITYVVLAASLGTFILVALIRPARRQVRQLAMAGVIGVAFQGFWGGITVRLDLAWWTVMPHLLVSLVLVFLAAMVVIRLPESDGPMRLTVPRPLALASWALAGVLAMVTVTGTLTTAAGPHAGDVKTPRLGWDLRTIAQTHADVMFLYLGLLVTLVVAFYAVKAPQVLLRRTWWLVSVTAAQGALGLAQYFLGVPEGMVVAHVALAVTVVAMSAFVAMGTRQRSEVAAQP